MWPTWVLSAPDGPRVGPTSLAIRDANVARNLVIDTYHSGLASNVDILFKMSLTADDVFAFTAVNFDCHWAPTLENQKYQFCKNSFENTEQIPPWETSSQVSPNIKSS